MIIMQKRKESEIMQVEFVCPKCDRHLAWAVRTATMSCPKCGKWVTDKNRKPISANVMLPVDSDQLVLF